MSIENEIRDKTWYVAIMNNFNDYSIFVGAYGEQYRDFKECAVKRGIQIVAEQFCISDEEINILDGFKEDGKPNEKNYLGELKQEIDSGMIQDYQKTLEDLVKQIKNLLHLGKS